MIAPALAAGTAAAVVALLGAERRGFRPGVWIAKPMASTGFVAFAVANGALSSEYGGVVLTALVLSWLGDVLLIPKGARPLFVAGLAAFLLAHLFFAAAFSLRDLSPGAVAVAALLMLPAAGLCLRWLRPHLRGAMRGAVALYALAISAMVVFAAGAAVGSGSAAIGVGAVAFAVSDLAVARERFVVRHFSNKLWGLPLYYAAQLLLATTPAAVAWGQGL